MHFEIQRNSEISLSKQIYLSIVDQIRSGFLQEGTQLPSIRTLTKQLKVSLVTVAKAYKKLEEDGFVTSIQGKGSFVNPERKKVVNRQPKVSPYNWQLSIQDYLPRSQFSRFHQVPEMIQLSSSMIDPRLFPNRFLEQEVQKIFVHNPRILSQYAEVQGDLELRHEMAAYLKRTDITTDPDNILVTNGSQQGIGLIARTFIGPDDVVIMEAPTYPGAIDVFRGRGATVLTVPIDKDGMRIDILQSLCDKYKPKVIYTVPTFHNPTGVITTAKRRRQILDIAQSSNSIIIEDDPWNEIYFSKKPPVPIKSLDDSGHVIYLKGLSKTFAPGCRIGVLVASGSIFNRLLAAKANADLGSPLLTQKMILPFIKSEKSMEHIKKLRTALKLRRDLVLYLLSKYAPSEVSWYTPEGGLNLWISLPDWVDTNSILLEAQKKKVTFLPGSACYPVELENHHMRLSFSYMSEQELKEGVKVLCHIFHSVISSKTAHDNSPFF